MTSHIFRSMHFRLVRFLLHYSMNFEAFWHNYFYFPFILVSYSLARIFHSKVKVSADRGLFKQLTEVVLGDSLTLDQEIQQLGSQQKKIMQCGRVVLFCFVLIYITLLCLFVFVNNPCFFMEVQKISVSSHNCLDISYFSIILIYYST